MMNTCKNIIKTKLRHNRILSGSCLLFFINVDDIFSKVLNYLVFSKKNWDVKFLRLDSINIIPSGQIHIKNIRT